MPINKWEDRFYKLVYNMALLGATDRQLALACNVDVTTIVRWRRENPAFNDAVHQGKDIANARVAEAIFKCSVGYDYEEEVVSNYKGSVTKVIVKRHKPPDTWAAFKWMALRERENWSEVHRVDINNNINITSLDLSGYSIEELALIEKLGMKQRTPELPQHGD